MLTFSQKFYEAKMAHVRYGNFTITFLNAYIVPDKIINHETLQIIMLEIDSISYVITYQSHK